MEGRSSRRKLAYAVYDENVVPSGDADSGDPWRWDKESKRSSKFSFKVGLPTDCTARFSNSFSVGRLSWNEKKQRSRENLRKRYRLTDADSKLSALFFEHDEFNESKKRNRDYSSSVPTKGEVKAHGVKRARTASHSGGLPQEFVRRADTRTRMMRRSMRLREASRAAAKERLSNRTSQNYALRKERGEPIVTEMYEAPVVDPGSDCESHTQGQTNNRSTLADGDWFQPFISEDASDTQRPTAEAVPKPDCELPGSRKPEGTPEGCAPQETSGVEVERADVRGLCELHIQDTLGAHSLRELCSLLGKPGPAQPGDMNGWRKTVKRLLVMYHPDKVVKISAKKPMVYKFFKRLCDELVVVVAQKELGSAGSGTGASSVVASRVSLRTLKSAEPVITQSLRESLRPVVMDVVGEILFAALSSVYASL